MQIVKFRCSPSILLGVTQEQINGVVREHIVSVGPFAQDSGRSVVVLDVQSSVQGPLTVVVDGAPDWIIDQLLRGKSDLTDARRPNERIPEGIVLPDRNGHSSVKTLDKLPT